MFIFNKVLVVEPHPDDGFVGAGGTLSRLIRENPKCSIWDTYMCPCLEDPRNEGIISEHKKSCDILGIENIIPNTFPRNNYIENNKQIIRDILYELKAKFQPELVLSPSSNEFHQDHKEIANCILTVFRNDSLIWCYEIPRSTSTNFKPNIYISLMESDVNKKLTALNCWKTQFKARGNFFYNDAFRASLVYRGLQSNTQWSECFEVIGRI
jgi:LmbE family N-acetylglucosaminyl deacetylase